MQNRGLPLLLLGCLLFSLKPAMARNGVWPLVVDMTTLNAEPRREAVTAFISSSTPFPPGTYYIVSGASPEFLELYRWLLPPEPVVQCELPLSPLGDELRRAGDQIVDLDLEDALHRLEALRETLSCRYEPLDRGQLRLLFYLEAVIYHYVDKPAKRDEAFRHALAIDHTQAPLAGYPPEIDDAFLAVSRRMEQETPVEIAVSPDQLRPTFRLDGAPLEPGPSVRLLPGFHVAQRQGPKGIWRTAVFEVGRHERRTLARLAAVDPGVSQAVADAMLRASLSDEKLTPAQIEALSRFSFFKQHPNIMFVLARDGSPSALKLLSFTPGYPLREGPPADLSVPGPIPLADDAGPPRKPRGRHRSRAERAGTSAFRLLSGAIAYDGRLFPAFHPEGTVSLWGPLGFSFALLVGNDLGRPGGAIEGEMGWLVGGRAGPEFSWGLGRWGILRAGVGAALTAARISRVEDQTLLILESSPEGWAGVGIRIARDFEFGAEFGGGYTPHVTGPGAARAFWQGGLTFGVLF